MPPAMLRQLQPLSLSLTSPLCSPYTPLLHLRTQHHHRLFCCTDTQHLNNIHIVPAALHTCVMYRVFNSGMLTLPLRLCAPPAPAAVPADLHTPVSRTGCSPQACSPQACSLFAFCPAPSGPFCHPCCPCTRRVFTTSMLTLPFCCHPPTPADLQPLHTHMCPVQGVHHRHVHHKHVHSVSLLCALSPLLPLLLPPLLPLSLAHTGC